MTASISVPQHRAKRPATIASLPDIAERGNVKNLWFHFMPYKDFPMTLETPIHPSGSTSTLSYLTQSGVYQHYNEYLLDQEN
ncbi:MAG: hypothetical protein Ct9H300mP8_09830 [Gammaproteobacteria bacterium]|nr:MAG: hypothetical protein Ct9H300mP8_09830 [Gammaproteobacteria bacterium]